MRNALSVDVEDYFQVGAFETVISREDWDSIPCRVELNTNRVLDLFAEARVKATFFTLGWVAKRHPALIRRIAEAGHEVASHERGSWERPAAHGDQLPRAGPRRRAS